MIYSYDGLNWILAPDVAFQHWKSICWSPELGIFAAVGFLTGSGYTDRKVMTSSLKGRPPTSYNVFDSSFNSIDESGNWSFSNISETNNLLARIAALEALVIPTASITASNAIITSGTFTYIKPIFTNATGTTALINGSTSVLGQSVISDASINTGILTSDASYNLLVTNILGAQRSASVFISVVPLPIASITTSKAIITSGTSTTIIPTFSNHVTALIDGSTNVQNQSFVSGTVINVGPLTQNRTYTLVVTNSAGTSVNADVNIIVNAAAIRTGWYGRIFIELVSGRATGTTVGFTYTIYKTSDTSKPLIEPSSLSISTLRALVSSVAHSLAPDDRLSNLGSRFLIVIDTVINGALEWNTASNSQNVAVYPQIGTSTSYPYLIEPTSTSGDIILRWTIETPG